MAKTAETTHAGIIDLLPSPPLMALGRVIDSVRCSSVRLEIAPGTRKEPDASDDA